MKSGAGSFTQIPPAPLFSLNFQEHSVSRPLALRRPSRRGFFALRRFALQSLRKLPVARVVALRGDRIGIAMLKRPDYQLSFIV